MPRGRGPSFVNKQVHLPYFHFATTPLPREIQAQILPGRQGAWDTSTVLTAFRLDQGGRLIIGSVGALRGTGTPIHAAFVKRYIRRLFPFIGKDALDTCWCGNIGMTNEHLPRLHRLAERVVAICAYNGRGIAPGTVMGRSLAQHVLGDLALEDMPLPVTEPKVPSFRFAREMYYEYGSQIAHLT